MSLLPPFKFAVRLTRKLKAQAGQLVYSKDRPSITACFYEFLISRGIALSPEESNCLHSLEIARPLKLGRPCIILGRLPDGGYNVCFIAQIRGRKTTANFSPIGRFFGVPLGSDAHSNSLTDQQSPKPSASSNPLRLMDAPGPHKGRFYLFAIPVVRRRIHIPPGKPRRLVTEDLETAIELVREREMQCTKNHGTLRREQLQWIAGNPSWKFKNPQEGGVDWETHLRL